ncbi:MAG: FAD binding domain-containing protein [Gammaproteobacteria bacterium]|nr:FAD binding domain-containing protein [Gammaproteobacteria bacterium]
MTFNPTRLDVGKKSKSPLSNRLAGGHLGNFRDQIGISPGVSTAVPEFRPLAVHRSRNLIHKFNLHRPRTTTEAVDMRRELGAKSMYMAGGIDVLNKLKTGFYVEDLIYLPSIDGLDGIVENDGFLFIGCLATHFDFENWLSRRHNNFPSLATTWRTVGNIRVRVKGTLAGNVMSHNPNYDVSPVLGALEAELIFDDATYTINGESLESYGNQDVGGGSLLHAIKVPLVPGREISYDRSMRPIVSVALVVDRREDFIIGARAGFGCAFDRPVSIRVPISEPIHVVHLADAAEQLAADTVAATPAARTDYLGSSEYRKRMGQVLLRRQLVRLGSLRNGR